MSLIQYELRNAAFLNILDFPKLLSKAEESAHLIEYIYSSLKSLLSLSSNTKHTILANTSPTISVFSEKIVISYPYETPQAAELLIRDCIYLYVLLLSNGILLRGVLSFGQLYHNKNVVFGPIFNKVNQLINLNNTFPRIIMDQTALEIEHTAHLYKQDADGSYFIDTMNTLQYIDKQHTIEMPPILIDSLSPAMTKLFSFDFKYNKSLLWLHQYLIDSSVIKEY